MIFQNSMGPKKSIKIKKELTTIVALKVILQKNYHNNKQNWKKKIQMFFISSCNEHGNNQVCKIS